VSAFKNAAEGYAASLRQQASWIDGAGAEDLDADELRAAADFIERQGCPQPAPETKTPSFRSEVFQAAERANKRFGQWMPQQWLEIFIGEMMKEPE